MWPCIVSPGGFPSFPNSALRAHSGGAQLRGLCWLVGSGVAATPAPFLFCVGSGNRQWPPDVLQHLGRWWELLRDALTAFKGTARNRCGHPTAQVGLAASACPFSSLSVCFPRSAQPQWPASVGVNVQQDAWSQLFRMCTAIFPRYSPADATLPTSQPTSFGPQAVTQMWNHQPLDASTVQA